MKSVKITAAAKYEHIELMKLYELPMENACSVVSGEVWFSKDCICPAGFCPHAWNDLYPYIFALANGADDLFHPWMKKKGTAMVSCSDGFRPVSFYLEALEEE